MCNISCSKAPIFPCCYSYGNKIVVDVGIIFCLGTANWPHGYTLSWTNQITPSVSFCLAVVSKCMFLSDLILIVDPIVGFCVCPMFCWTLFCVFYGFAIVLKGKRESKRELVALLYCRSWCIVIVMWLFLKMTWVGRMIVVFPDHTHLFFVFIYNRERY